MVDWNRIKEITVRAAEVPGDKRLEYVEQACGGNQMVTAYVMSLLTADSESSDQLLNGSIWQLFHSDTKQRSPGVEGYDLIEGLGQGGMGTVFKAKRTRDGHTVAIKLFHQDVHPLLKWSLVAGEIRALSSLSHPAIVRFIEANQRGDQAFMVMEYVDGIPIDQYCLQRKLKTPQILSLFLDVLDGVSHFHQHLVIHRDIKPQNILVTPDGKPKILDFGISKMIRDETMNTSGLTLLGFKKLTPEFASPEQFTGEPVSIRSDIYSLAVLLYRLLSGRAPYAPPKNSEHLREMIQNVAPLPLVGRDHRGVKKDLENIVFKAMEKHPAQRYESVAHFADDIRSHLEGQPVTAKQKNWFDKGILWLNRHRKLTVIIAVVLVGLAGLSGVFWIQKRTLTEREQTIARSNQYMTELLAFADLSESESKVLSAKGFLDYAMRNLERELEGSPDSQIQMLDAIIVGYYNLGFYSDAVTAVRSQLSLMELNPQPVERVVQAHKSLGIALVQAGEVSDAEAQILLAYHMALEKMGPLNVQTLSAWNNVAYYYFQVSRYRDAAVVLAQMESMIKRPEAADYAEIWYDNYGLMLNALGRFDEAEKYVRLGLERRQATYEGRHSDLAISYNNLGVIYRDLGDFTQALEMFYEALEIDTDNFGGASYQSASRFKNIGIAFLYQGDYWQSAWSLGRAIEIFETLPPEYRQDWLCSRFYYEMAKRNNAFDVAAAQQILEEFELEFSDHYLAARMALDLGVRYMEQGRLNRSCDWILRAQDIFRLRVGDDHYLVNYCKILLGVSDEFGPDQVQVAWSELERQLPVSHPCLQEANQLITPQRN